MDAQRAGKEALMFIDTSNAIVPVLIPQTAPAAVTGWNSNWVIGGLLGAGLLLGWMVSGYSRRRKNPVVFRKRAARRRKRKRNV